MYLPPSVTYTGQLRGAAPGGAAVFDTLRHMRAAVNAAKVDPEIIAAAHSIIFLTPERDQHAEARALFEFVRDHVRYVPDVWGVETIAYPLLTLRKKTGDCDDQTALLCALLESVGFPTRFVMTGYSGPDFEHVYCQALIDGQWIAMDPIDRSNAMGSQPLYPTRVYVERV